MTRRKSSFLFYLIKKLFQVGHSYQILIDFKPVKARVFSGGGAWLKIQFLRLQVFLILQLKICNIIFCHFHPPYCQYIVNKNKLKET